MADDYIYYLAPSEREARALWFCQDALSGHPSYATRGGAGPRSGPRTRGTLTGNPDLVAYGGQFGVLGPARYPPLFPHHAARVRDTEQQVPGPGPRVKHIVRPLTLERHWRGDLGLVNGFYREYLQDLDPHLQVDLVALEPPETRNEQAPTLVHSFDGHSELVLSAREIRETLRFGFSTSEQTFSPIPLRQRADDGCAYFVGLSETQWNRYPRAYPRRELSRLFASFADAYLLALDAHIVNRHRVEGWGVFFIANSSPAKFASAPVECT